MARVSAASSRRTRSTSRRSEQQERLADAPECGGLEHAGIDEPGHPAEAAARIRVVVEAADRCEAPAAAKVPLLDLVVPIFDVGAEAVEIVAKALLDRAQPCLLQVVAGVDTALLEEVVLDLLEDQRVEVAPRLAPIGCLAGLEPNQLDREPGLPGARQCRGGHARDVALLVERMLEFVVGKRLGLRIVALGDRLEKRLTCVVAGKALVDDGPADRHAFL